MKSEIVLFTDSDVKHAIVSEHISNILALGELNETSVGFSDRSTGGRKTDGRIMPRKKCVLLNE